MIHFLFYMTCDVHALRSACIVYGTAIRMPASAPYAAAAHRRVRRLVGDRHEDPVGLREDALYAAQDTVGVEDDGIVVDRGAQDLDKLWKLRILQRRDILR